MQTIPSHLIDELESRIAWLQDEGWIGVCRSIVHEMRENPDDVSINTAGDYVVYLSNDNGVDNLGWWDCSYRWHRVDQWLAWACAVGDRACGQIVWQPADAARDRLVAPDRIDRVLSIAPECSTLATMIANYGRRDSGTWASPVCAVDPDDIRAQLAEASRPKVMARSPRELLVALGHIDAPQEKAALPSKSIAPAVRRWLHSVERWLDSVDQVKAA